MTECSLKMSEWVSGNFERFGESLNGESATPFHQIRQQAFGQFTELGFPSPRLERWKYTNVTPLSRIPFGLPSRDDTSSIDPHLLAAHLIDGVSEERIVIVDGVYSPELSTAKDSKRVIIRSIREELRTKYSEHLEPYLAKVASYDDHPFVALNTAFIDDGVFISIAANEEIEAPIHIFYVSSGNHSSVALYPRTVIVAHEGSAATVLESFIGTDKSEYLTAAVSEIVLKKNANLGYYRLQHEGEAAYHMSSIFLHQETNSSFHARSFSFGSRLARNEIHAELDGEDVFTGLAGLTALTGTQHVDNHLVVDHAKPRSESSELYKGVYAGTSHGVFSGTIIVRPDAQKTNAFQSNRSLLLSKDAASYSMPQLKIWADDVKCSHGATVGELEEDALYYLRSRGIPVVEAKKMLVQAFAGEVLSAISHESLREHLRELFLAKITGSC